MSIELKDITKVVNGATHIHPTSVALQDCEFNVLLGATLSGKTTLLRLLAGLEKPSTGEVLLDGRSMNPVSVQRRSVAMVYQEFINYPNMTVFENIASPLKVKKMPSPEIKRRVGDIAELLNLSDMLDRDVSNLSGGQQQRTALARALVKNASLVLLDEPLANLDYKLREQLRDELPRLFEKSDTTVVYATSEPEEALMLGGYTAALHEGRVEQYGRTIDIYRKPQNLHCAKIFSHPPINLAPVVKSADHIRFADIAEWSCPDAMKRKPDGPYTLGIRPYDLTLARSDKLDCVALSSGVVQLAELTDSESLIHFEIEGNKWISESAGVHRFAAGSQIEVHMNLGGCHYFDEHGISAH